VTELESALTRRLEELEKKMAEVASVERQRDEYHRLYLETMERCRMLERGILASKSERHEASDQQLALGVLGMMLGDRERRDVEEALKKAETISVPEHTRQKPTGRKPIPEDLPRVDVEVLPPEVQRAGLEAYERIGEEVSETIERRPASLVVVRITRPKFVPKDRKRDEPTKVEIAEPPELPIPKGLAGPGLLADTIVKRWQDHIPLNRQEGIYAREGMELARSTIGHWHFELAELVSPLLAAMRQDAFKQPYICTDATGVLVQQPEKCRTGHFWVLVAPRRHVLFEYTPQHDSEAVDDVLAGYEGYVVADAHAVYDHLYETGRVVEVNCWAHCRRYFFKAVTSDPKRATTALDLIGMLFRIERTLANSPRKKKEAIRNKRSKPIVDSFFSWCDAEAPLVLDDTPISDGIRYARNQRVGLSRFIEDGRLPIHNNLSELNLRREAIGRKNWLFVGNDEGGSVNARFVSLLASCRLCGVEPWSYLRDLLCLLPRWPAHQLLELSPVEWNRTRERDDVRRALDANHFRKAVLEKGV
jgi:transposase